MLTARADREGGNRLSLFRSDFASSTSPKPLYTGGRGQVKALIGQATPHLEWFCLPFVLSCFQFLNYLFCDVCFPFLRNNSICLPNVDLCLRLTLF